MFTDNIVRQCLQITLCDSVYRLTVRTVSLFNVNETSGVHVIEVDLYLVNLDTQEYGISPTSL